MTYWKTFCLLLLIALENADSYYKYGNNIDQKEAEVFEVYEDPKETKRTTKRPYCEFSEEAKKSKLMSFLNKVRNQRFRIVKVWNKESWKIFQDTYLLLDIPYKKQSFQITKDLEAWALQKYH